MRRFVLVLQCLTAICHIPFALFIQGLLSGFGKPSAISASVALTILLSWLLRERIAHLADDQPLPAWRRRLIEEPYYAHWCAVVGSVPLFSLGALLCFGVSLADPAFWPGWPALGCGSYAVALIVSLWAVFVRRRWFIVREVKLELAGWPGELDGYRIAHLSDLHIGSLYPPELARKWIDRVNTLEVDLAVFTGDYVTSGTRFHADIASVMSGARAKDGMFAVMGNHDYFGDGEPLVVLLQQNGVQVLRNEHREIQRGSARFVLAGVDDTWTRRSDPTKALSGVNEDLFSLVLAHDPKLFPQLMKLGANLVLSGHTHWGQLGVPFISERANVSALTYELHAGLHSMDEAHLYINPGLGTTGPPFRFGVAPEITVFSLKAKADALPSRPNRAKKILVPNDAAAHAEG